MFSKVLVANRGEIACRIIRTLRKMGLRSVAVHSEADENSLWVSLADEACAIGPPQASQSYLDFDQIFAAVKKTGAEAIHPGYGFLSENPAFAQACQDREIIFIGPTTENMRRFGLKHAARELASELGVPLLPGSDILASADHALKEALAIGYPIMLKSTAGGGGIGMSLCRDPQDLAARFDSLRRQGGQHFQNEGLFLEKYLDRARHIEVQIFGDGNGRVVCLGDRDCSIQRRHQKVIEETPAPGLTRELRDRLHSYAQRLGEACRYASAGTVEFIYNEAGGEFFFLEVNTRLQVEHTVTEEVLGIDLVEWMIRQAAGEHWDLTVSEPRGVAIQARIYAEDPGKDFHPCAGRLTEVEFPDWVRLETWVKTGTEISPFYDPLLAKLIVHQDSREEAAGKLREALEETALAGIETNLAYLRQIAGSPAFRLGAVHTRFLQELDYRASTVEVLAAGTMSSIQDYPGRTGFWMVGVPPSGPMDHLSFRLGNSLLGNHSSCAGMEMTVSGPILLFNEATVICLTGATMKAELDGEEIPFWTVIPVKKGAFLRLGALTGDGQRAYLTIRGGFEVPAYLGSLSTFTLGEFGGHCGRVLKTGDILHFHEDQSTLASPALGRSLPRGDRPTFTRRWELDLLYGPHGAPDFFTERDISVLLEAEWVVHYNSSRTGIRLIGPQPEWARPDGGEAGLHPSNIDDTPYAIGSLDFTGDMPVILGPDGPSLGGFVCPGVVIQSELWKLGQLKPGDTVRFRFTGRREAERREAELDQWIERLRKPPEAVMGLSPIRESAVIEVLHEREERQVILRAAGDKNLLVEFGEARLDLNLRLRVHSWMNWLEDQSRPGVLDLTPGIRSLQIHFDNRILPVDEVVNLLHAADRSLPPTDEMSIPSRIVHLPLSWDDEATSLAIRKYMTLVRKDAPWCPSNLEFIRRINGLDSIDEVKRIVFEASYLVLGLGDVYLGAPVATPVDPRHRLVTTKYNPARTWTPENAVGIGGAYLCVYGMEGPGGYQLVGRTLQMWNRYNQTSDFEPGQPWLLRFFDQIRFFPVSHDELIRIRKDFLEGRYNVKVEDTVFRQKDHNQFLRDNHSTIQEFKARQQAAFEEERLLWEISGQNVFQSDDANQVAEDHEVPPGCTAVETSVSGSLWKITVQRGDLVAKGQVLAIMESMKMEIPIEAPISGVLERVLSQEGAAHSAGQKILILRASP